jgi:drug/metabolite transporter (DMT)-like permease
VTLYIVWGSTYLAIRVGVRTLPPLAMASIRFLIAGAVLYVFAIRAGDRQGDRPSVAHWRSALVVGGLLLAGGNGGVSIGERFVSSGLAALLVATVPLWIVLFGHFSGAERLTRRVGLGIVVGFAGMGLLAQSAGREPSQLFGIVALLLAALAWAAGSDYARRAPLPRRPLVSTAMQMLAGGALLGVLAIFTGDWARFPFQHMDGAAIASVAYLVVFGSLIGFSSYVYLLKVAGPAVVSTYAFVNPVVAVALGAAFLGEAVTGRTLLAGGVIVAAVALIVSGRFIRLPRRASRKQPAEACAGTVAG